MNICPLCLHKNRKGATNCSGCGQRMYTEPQTEWRSRIEEVAKGYRQPPAKGIPHGVQKDAIQNSWGARRSVKRGAGWGTEFALVVAGKKTYLTVTDCGTHGLTGRPYADPEEIPDELPPNERLARFENMNFSGGDYGPGLYGRGKLVFQAASKTRQIIYDSLLADGTYRLGRRFQDGRHLRQFPRAMEGKDAKTMLASLTEGSLRPISHPGMRVTIVDPLDDIVDVVKTGKLLDFIEESWWEILLKYNVHVRVVFDGSGRDAECPELLRQLASGTVDPKRVHRVENQAIEVKGNRYRVKRLCMARAQEPVREGLRGLYVQRKGMKVTTIELKEMPADLEDHFYGFMELDKGYEELIIEAENIEHYGFSAQFASYRELKKFAQLQFDAFKRKLGYAIDTGKTADQRAREALRTAHQKLNDIMDDLGLTGIGQPPRRSHHITVRVQNATFPHETNEVVLGERISDIRFRIRNHAPVDDYDLRLVVETRQSNSVLIEHIRTENLRIEAGEQTSIGPFCIDLRRGKYPNHAEILCICRAEATSGEKLAQARIPIYIGMKPVKEEVPVALRLRAIDFPRKDSRRVDFGDEIKNVCYVVKNQTANRLKVKFIVRTLDKEHDKRTVETLHNGPLTLNPMAEDDLTLDAIRIERNTYGYIDEGELILRARIVSAQDQHGHEKGDILAEHNISFLLRAYPNNLIFR